MLLILLIRLFIILVPYQPSASVLPIATQEAKETSSSPLDITSSLTDMTSLTDMISTESLTQSRPKTLASGYISTSTKLPTETPTNSTSSDSGSFFVSTGHQTAQNFRCSTVFIHAMLKYSQIFRNL